MQDKIILGILQYSDMTSYEIKKAIEKSTAFFYNASMGSIHPALKKLEGSDCVSINSTIENGRAKKIYSITNKGRAVFTNWLSEGLPLEKFKDETLVRLFFFGYLKPEERALHIKSHITSLQEQIEVLEVLREQISELDVPKGLRTHADYQIATLDFGISYFKFSSDWYQKFLLNNV